MKKWLWIPALIVVFLVGDRLVGGLLQKWTDQSQFRFSRLYQSKEKADILLIGNSRGLIFYQPEIEKLTGKKTLNLSYNALSMDLAEALIYDFLDQGHTPKHLVIDVTMCDRTNNPLIGEMQCYRKHSTRLSKLIQDSLANPYYAGNLSHLFRFNSEIFQRAMYYRSKSDADWLLDRVINDEMQQQAAQLPAYTFTQPATMLDALSRVVQTAQSKGIEIHLVVNPYYPAFAKSFTNLQAFKEAVTQKTGFVVLDYSNVIKETVAFGDYQHLNKAGSVALMETYYKDGIFGKPN